MSELKYSEWLPISVHQNLAPIYILFGVLDEAKHNELLELAIVKTFSDLGIFSKEDVHRFSNDPAGLKILEDKLEDQSIDCINTSVVADAEWRQVNERTLRYREELATSAPFGELLPNFETVRNAVFLAQELIRDTLPSVTDDQLDNSQRNLFHHAISDCLAIERKRREEKTNPPVLAKPSDLISQFAQSHLKGFNKLQGDIPDPEWNEITKEGRIQTCKTFGIREDQFLDYLNHPKKTVAVAKTLYAQIKIMAAEYSYMHNHMNKQKATIERRIDAFLNEPGESSSCIKTPTRDEVRGAIELAAMIVKMEIPKASLDKKHRPVFHNCISSLLKLAAECSKPSSSESYADLAQSLLPFVKKTTALVKYQA